MKGSALMQDNDGGSVTMLRTPAAPPTGGSDAQPPPMQPGFQQPDNTGTQTQSAPSQVMTARGHVPQDGAQAPRPGISRRTLYTGAAVVIVATALPGFVAMRHGVSLPFAATHEVAHSSDPAVNPAPASARAATISPPQLDAASVSAQGGPVQPPTLPRNAAIAHPPGIPATPAPAGISDAALPTSLNVAMQPAQPQPPALPSAPVAALPAAPPTQPAVEAPSTAPTQPSAEDRLLVEVSHRMEELSDHVDALEHQLDTTQQAMGERLATSIGEFGGRLDELRHRQDMLETQAHEQAASRAQPQPAPAPATEAAAPAGAAPSAAPPAKASPAPEKKPARHESAHHEAPAAPAVSLPHYTVQAAAPDIAILTGPEGSPIRVEPGTDLGAWGKVSTVRQERNGWVVQTDHGVIR